MIDKNEERPKESRTILYEIYSKIFQETLKNRAYSLWLSSKEWEELSKNNTIRKDYTDFFSNLHDELRKRSESWYHDISDLLNPSTKNLYFQITEDAIKEAFIDDLFMYIDNRVFCMFNVDFSFDEQYRSNMEYDKKNLFNFHKMLKNNTLWDYLKSYCESHYPLSDFEKKIPFQYDKELLLKNYNECINSPLSTCDINMTYERLILFYREELTLFLEKNINNQELILQELKDISEIFYKLAWYFLEFYEDNLEFYEDNLKNDYNNNKNHRLELIILKIFSLYKKEIIHDVNLCEFYIAYINEKLKFTIIEEEIPLFKKIKQLSFSKEEINKLISEFKDNKKAYEVLQIYHLIYLDIWERKDREKYIKELLYRLKRISWNNDNIILWLKEYLSFILSSTFLFDFNWERKPWYFNEISEDLKEIFWEKEYNEFEKIFTKSNANVWDKSIRKNYKIGLVFWDIKSKKAFDLYSNDKRNESDFTDRQLKKKQFEILTEEFKEQQRLNIENKLKKGSLSFILVFEMDHETKLNNLKKIYPDRIIVCRIPGQHFSHEQFYKMLDLGLENIEKNLIYNKTI